MGKHQRDEVNEVNEVNETTTEDWMVYVPTTDQVKQHDTWLWLKGLKKHELRALIDKCAISMGFYLCRSGPCFVAEFQRPTDTDREVLIQTNKGWNALIRNADEALEVPLPFEGSSIVVALGGAFVVSLPHTWKFASPSYTVKTKTRGCKHFEERCRIAASNIWNRLSTGSMPLQKGDSVICKCATTPRVLQFAFTAAGIQGQTPNSVWKKWCAILVVPNDDTCN